jgi:hypothetical protein
VGVRAGIIATAVIASALVAGCASDNEPAASQATPDEAITEIGAVRKGLDGALSTYRSGDRAAADEQVGTAYLEHFEHVEGPLGKVDAELNESLEEAIREELRDRIKAGAPAAEVQSKVEAIKADLAKAEAALR